jgi:Ca2+/Na+ antiporter
MMMMMMIIIIIIIITCAVADLLSFAKFFCTNFSHLFNRNSLFSQQSSPIVH